jgi:beta-xylosidase
MKYLIEKHSLMIILHILLILFFAGCRKNGAEGIEEPEPTLPLVIVTADYTNVVSSYDKTKVLNVARGGHGINTDLTWMPGFYDKLVEIGVDEFRIDWLLSDWFYKVVSRNGNGELEYDFSRLDKIILPLVERGMKPMMCMCYMASALGNNEGQPNDYEEYSEVIRAYVRHYKDLGYTGWAWESHNEPEGFTKLTPAETYKMYRYFSAAVKEVDPSARVGGYGSVGRDWLGYANSFLDLYKNDAEKPVMDFFSFHQYGKSSWEYVNDIEYAFQSRGLAIPDLYLTEWNNSYGQGYGEGNLGTTGGGYDTNVNASYVAKKFFNAFDYTNLKKIYFWNFADADPGKTFGGDVGLFTVDRHRKAAANTFYFYNQLHETVLSALFSGIGTQSKDAHGIITVNDVSKNMAMIFWNHQYDAIKLRTKIDNLPMPGSGKKYQMNKLLIDATNGNYYYDFKNGFSGTGTGPNENAEIEKSFQFTGTQFLYSDTLQPNSVVLYLIEQQ